MKDPIRTVTRGVRVNALGVVARVLQPVAFGALTRWYGPDVMGVFLLASATFDTLVTLATAGLSDAVVALVSPLDEASDRVYVLLASAFVFAAGASAVGVVFDVSAALMAPSFLPQDGVADALIRLAPALPLSCLTAVVIGATRARFVQVWDVALAGVARPALVIGCGWVLAAGGADARTLAAAYVVAHTVVAGAAVIVFGRFFSWRRLARHARRLPLDGALLRFAVPQNLNMGIYALTHGASVLALGTAGLSPRDVALFGTAQGIVLSLRHVRLVFTSAMSPVVATLFAGGRLDDLQAVVTRAVRWSLVAALPVAFAIVAWRNPLMRLFHPSYEIAPLAMALLVAGPLLNNVAGFASNVIVMTGHVGWNLFNTTTATVITYGFTWLLAPRFGMLGAALAAAAAGLVVAAMQIAEARVLVGVTPRPWAARRRNPMPRRP